MSKLIRWPDVDGTWCTFVCHREPHDDDPWHHGINCAPIHEDDVAFFDRVNVERMVE